MTPEARMADRRLVALNISEAAFILVGVALIVFMIVWAWAK